MIQESLQKKKIQWKKTATSIICFIIENPVTGLTSVATRIIESLIDSQAQWRNFLCIKAFVGKAIKKSRNKTCFEKTAPCMATEEAKD